MSVAIEGRDESGVLLENLYVKLLHNADCSHSCCSLHTVTPREGDLFWDIAQKGKDVLLNSIFRGEQLVKM